LFLASRTECTACKLPTMDEALAAAAAPLGESWAPPPAKKHKAKKHKKNAGKKRRRDDVDGSCIAARALAGGFVRESELLPPEAAAAAADLVRQAPEEAWRRSSAKTDAKAHGKKTNTTRHSYAVGDGGVDAPDADVEALLERVLESVAPREWLRARRLVPRLQLGRYGRGDHIVKHDDAAVVEIDGVPHERRIALVYYLTGEPTWDASLGGLFVDHASGRRFAPVHNTLVAFRVRAVLKSTSELDYPEKYCVDLCEAPRHRADAIGDNVASMAWELHAIEQTELRRKYRADGGAPEI
jgi:hypothetical protein